MTTTNPDTRIPDGDQIPPGQPSAPTASLSGRSSPSGSCPWRPSSWATCPTAAARRPEWPATVWPWPPSNFDGQPIAQWSY